MDIQEELVHYEVCIKRWKEMLQKHLAEGGLEDAAFFARAISNEYARLSILLHEEHQRLASGKPPG